MADLGQFEAWITPWLGRHPSKQPGPPPALRDYVIDLERRGSYWRDLLADVLGDIDPLRHSPAIDAAREALRNE